MPIIRHNRPTSRSEDGAIWVLTIHRKRLETWESKYVGVLTRDGIPISDCILASSKFMMRREARKVRRNWYRRNASTPTEERLF